MSMTVELPFALYLLNKGAYLGGLHDMNKIMPLQWKLKDVIEKVTVKLPGCEEEEYKSEEFYLLGVLACDRLQHLEDHEKRRTYREEFLKLYGEWIPDTSYWVALERQGEKCTYVPYQFVKITVPATFFKGSQMISK